MVSCGILLPFKFCCIRLPRFEEEKEEIEEDEEAKDNQVRRKQRTTCMQNHTVPV